MKKLCVIIMFAFVGAVSNAQNIYTAAGNGSNSYNIDNIPATSAGLVAAGAIALDKAGNIYIADMYNNRIRKVDVSTGIITTIAGTGNGGYNGDGILATTAEIYYPMAVALDTSGNVFIGDYSNNRIRKIDVSTGMISTVAGTGTYGFNGDNILATTAEITECTGMAVDQSGNVYFSDFANGRIRKINKLTGLITTIAGNGLIGYTGDNCLADTTRLNHAHGIAIDKYNNIYIADQDNDRIRKVDAVTGIITTVAGRGVYNIYNGDGIPADSAYFRNPTSVAVDDSCNIYIADEFNEMIHKVYHSTGLIFTIAGTGVGGNSPDGTPAVTALLNDPRGVAVDACGNVYISEYNNSRIRKIFSYALSTSFTNINCYGACTGTLNSLASGGASPFTYSWSGGLGSNPNHANVCAGSYYLVVTDMNGCKENFYFTLTEPNSILVNITTSQASCQADGGASAIAVGGISPYTYSWPNGSTLDHTTGLGSGNYILTVTDYNSCIKTKPFVITNNHSSFPSAPICMVTVDSSSLHNIIVWDKTTVTNVDSFIVYREISTGNYMPIARMPYAALSQFTDTVRTLYFPNTGNPNTGTFRYKIQCHDTCGDYSVLSPYHNTIYFLNNNGTFYWTQPYTIENGANPVASYVLMRDNLSNGNWQDVSSVAGTQQVVSDPLYAIYQATGSWRVRTQWSINCSPTKTASPAFGSSLSNIFSNYITVGLNENSIENKVAVFPNPATDNITIVIPQKAIIEILNIEGQIIKSINAIESTNNIDISSFANGMYFVKVKTDNEIAMKKFIKE